MTYAKPTACLILSALAGCVGGGPNNDNGFSGSKKLTVSDAGQGEDAGDHNGSRRDGGDENWLVDPRMCGADENGTPYDTSAQGGCYYGYCYTTLEGLKDTVTPGGACAMEQDAALQCEGTVTIVTSKCARSNAGQIGDEARFRAAIKACVLEDAQVMAIHEPCIDCYVETAVCAGKLCTLECISGDSPACDECREEKGCTPDFYVCAGLPDPLKL